MSRRWWDVDLDYLILISRTDLLFWHQLMASLAGCITKKNITLYIILLRYRPQIVCTKLM